METNPLMRENTLQINLHELLMRFLIKCKNDIEHNEQRASFISSCADIVAAVYYHRQIPDVNDFINKYLKNKNDYLQIQWARKTWETLSRMSEPEISDLVINQIYSVDYSEEEQ